MRVNVFILLAGVVMAAGCTGSNPKTRAPATDASVFAGTRPSPASSFPSSEAGAKSTRDPNDGAGNAAESSMIVTPNPVLVGKVVSANASARFVVLNFPVGHLPLLEQQLDVLRHGIKVGEVKVTGPQRDDYIVADVTVGEAGPGDEVRAR